MTGERIDGAKSVNNIITTSLSEANETNKTTLNSTWGDGFASSDKGTFGFTPEFMALFDKFADVDIPKYPNGGYKTNINPTDEEVASMAKSDAIVDEMTDDDLIPA